MTRGQKTAATVLVLVAAIGAFGLHARSEARDRALWYCQHALNERYEKDGYAFVYRDEPRSTDV